MRCPSCGRIVVNGDTVKSEGFYNTQMFKCPNCHGWNSSVAWRRDLVCDAMAGKSYEADTLRPNHYKKGQDTFAWADEKFDVVTNVNICRFNIHKYNDRDKGEDVKDFRKVIDYAKRAIKLLDDDDIEERR